MQQLLIKDLVTLKSPLAVKFSKKNPLHPFEDASSLEFFAEKNDTSMLVFSSHSKKRPHAMTFLRCFGHRTLDMLELMIVPESVRTLQQFKNARKPALGLKPLVCFAGTPFENPVPSPYTLAKSMLLDFFKGPDTPAVDVEGLQYMIQISAADELPEAPSPLIQVRAYLIRTRRAGARTPLVEIEEMGPRVDFRLGRTRDPDSDMLKEAMKRPKRTSEPRAKKNIETDLMGDKVGRIHVGRQNLDKLQTRKMKGLKRGAVVDADVDAANGADSKRAKIDA